MKFFQRALTRAGFNLKFSQGFNPRPKMSLPLPRSVGVASDDEMLTANIDIDEDIKEHIKSLTKQLPDGCGIIEAGLYESKISYKPESAVYRFELKGSFEQKPDLQKNDGLIERKSKSGDIKKIDINEFIKNIDIDKNSVNVSVAITEKGSLRVEEILNILNIDRSTLAAPVRRTFVEWKKK